MFLLVKADFRYQNMQRRKILIATKTYPSISRKYRETVCTAGVLLDDNEKSEQWIRIYPIRFRANDLYFIVGNLKNHKNVFMIIGLFYPMLPKNNPTLDLF